MGYDLNKFVDIQQLPNHLKCLICNLILENPLQTPCEHNFCNQCITVHLQTIHHCPHLFEDTASVKSDKKKSPLKKISSFRKIIGKSPKDKLASLKLSDLKCLPDGVIEELNALKVNCDFHSNGCKEELVLSNLNEHVKHCQFVNEKKLNAEEKNLTKEENRQKITGSTEHPEQSKQNIHQQQLTDLEVRLESDKEMDPAKEQPPKRKDSENKSINSESKLASEEDANSSDDFVVISKNLATKSTESVQTTNSDPTIISSKENVNKEDDKEETTSVGGTTTEKKKKKKKKKNKSNSTKLDEDTISQSSLKATSSDASKMESSKESLVDNNTEELKRQLKDAETKSENLRLVNSQLLGQIKKLKEEKEEVVQKLGTNEQDLLKNKIQQLEKENKSQALKIINLIDSNENLNKFIKTLREDQTQIKERYNSTLNDVQQTLKIFKTCKQQAN